MRVNMISFRIGHGYDIHPFEKDKPLMLGGELIPFESGMKGHSDGDVVIHAICDAMLGAAALGDMGQYFPDTDPRYKQASSINFLTKIYNMLLEQGWKIGNIDVSIIAQVPKLAPHIKKMIMTLSKALDIELNKINIKATTNEKLDAVGKCEAIAVHAVVLIVK